METSQFQNPAQKIDFELDTKCIIIYGKPRHGKTILSAVIGYESYKKRVYSNFNIYYKGESINRRYKTFEDIERIRFSNTHGCIIVDESGINVNSRNSMTDENKLMSKILFLSGKKNCDMILIAQKFKNIDVNFRDLASAIFEVEKIKREGKKPLFIVRRQIPWGGQVKTIAEYHLETLSIMEKWKITYDTLDEAIIGSEKKQKKKDIEEEKQYKKDGLL